MQINRIERDTIINCSLEEAWKFFSDARNLKQITPKEMDMQIASVSRQQEVYSGQLISYRVSVLPGYRTSWVTEITQVDRGRYFIDEQRSGPYKIWHHEHWFTESERGVEMKDIICFAMPFGALGALLKSFVRKKVEGIFDYRAERIKQLFS